MYIWNQHNIANILQYKVKNVKVLAYVIKRRVGML